MIADTRPELTSLIGALGGAPVWCVIGGSNYVESFLVRVGDVELRGAPLVAPKGALLGVTFTVALPRPLSDAPILLRREGAIDRFGKALGINLEVSTGDAVFDRAVYVESDASDATVGSLLSLPQVRSAVLALLGVLGPGAVSEIIVHRTESLLLGAPETLFVEVLRDRFGDVPAIRAALIETARLGGALAQLGGKALVPARAAPRRRAMGLGLAALCLTLSTCAIDAPPLVDGDATLVGFGAGLAAWILALVLIVALFRGRSTGLRYVLAFSLLYLPLLLLVGLLAVRRANAALDDSPAMKRRGRAHLQQHPKAATDVVLEMPGASTINVPLEYVRGLRSWDATRDVIVTTRPGAFGWEWVVALELKR